MTTIVTRAGKGSPLTHTEVDTNFTNLNTAKLETAAIPLGTLQAPSVSFLNDSDTGIFCPQGGNSLAVATGGQYAITCTSTQAVGIKTANPQKTLHVAGPTRVGADDATDAFLEIGEGATGNRNSYIDIVADTTYTDYGLRVIRNNTGANATSELKHRGTGALNIVAQDAAPIEFYTTNSPRLTILAGGNVGIGTSSPASTLHVAGTFRNTGQTFLGIGEATTLAYIGDPFTTNTRSIIFNRATGVTDIVNIQGLNAGVGLTDIALQAGGGRVGIGTTSPSSALHVVGTATFNIAQSFIANSATGSVGTFQHNSTSIGDIGSGNQTLSGGSTGDFALTSRAGALAFGINTTEKARLDTSGRLLVGTSTAPTQASFNQFAKLVVQGNTFSAAGNAILSLNRGEGATGITAGEELGVIAFGDNDGNTFGIIQCVADAAAGASDFPGRLVFSSTADGAASPTEAMRINSQQELLVGTTTRNANGGVLQLKSGITFPATAVAASDANTLDDYEEGTWTPSIGGTATYTHQNARYTKIGRMVYVSAIFAVNIIGTGSTSTISGLPFGGASGNVGTEAGLSISYFANLASNVVSLSANANTGTNIDFYGLTAAGAGVTVISPFQNGTRIDFAGWYITA